MGLAIGIGCGLLLLGVAVWALVRWVRNLYLVSPILLDEALDPDLRRLRHTLRRRSRLSLRRRRELARQLLVIAARRAARGDDGTAPGEAEVTWEALERDAREGPGLVVVDPRPGLDP